MYICMYVCRHFPTIPAHVAYLETSRRPLEIQIKIYGFKESLTAQHEFVVIGPQVGQWGLSEDLTGFTSFTFTHICAFFFFLQIITSLYGQVRAGQLRLKH